MRMRVWMWMTRRHGRSRVGMRRCRWMNDVASRIGYGTNVSSRCRRRDMFPQSSSSVTEPYLNPGFWQSRPLSKFLSNVNVRILSLLECSFQFVQLVSREGRPASSLLPFQRNPWFALAIGSRTCFPYKKSVLKMNKNEIWFIHKFTWESRNIISLELNSYCVTNGNHNHKLSQLLEISSR